MLRCYFIKIKLKFPRCVSFITKTTAGLLNWVRVKMYYEQINEIYIKLVVEITEYSPVKKGVVSPANKKEIYHLIFSWRSYIQTRNGKGPNTDPRGILVLILHFYSRIAYNQKLSISQLTFKDLHKSSIHATVFRYVLL